MGKISPYIPQILVFLAFIFSVLKYFDLKHTEEKRLNYENYNRILDNISGKLLENGKITVEIGFLIANIYKLTEFPQYKKISLPVLDYMKACPIKTDNKSLEYINKAIDNVYSKLYD